MKIVDFTEDMLANRATRLRFNDHKSDIIPISNGIGQGDPLSMGLYQYYNADLLDIPNEANQLAIAYIDDALLYATASTFEETHRILERMMTKDNSVIEWSKDHNSPLEYSKLALINFAHQNRHMHQPDLTLPHTLVKPEHSTKYLGVIIDQHLSWMQQHVNAIDKGAKWTSQIRRIVRIGWGITPKYVRKLYIGVALPKILYVAEVWYTPLHDRTNGQRKGGSVKVIKQLTRTQRAGALVITGGLCTSPTDTLDALTNLLPFHMIMEKWCYRAAVHLTSLPDKHPLHKPVKLSAKHLVKKHRSPLHNLLRLLDTDLEKVSKATLAMHNPAKTR